MKFLKDNLKVIIAFIVGIVLAGGIVYAATSAKEITYATSKNADIKTVEEALDDLYSNMSNETQTITTNGEQVLDKYCKKLNINVIPSLTTSTGWTTYGGYGYKNGAGSAENVISGLTIGQPYLIQILGAMEASNYTSNINFQFDGANCTNINTKSDYCGNKITNGNYAEWYTAIYYCIPTSSSVKITVTNPNNYWMWFYSNAYKIFD